MRIASASIILAPKKVKGPLKGYGFVIMNSFQIITRQRTQPNSLESDLRDLPTGALAISNHSIVDEIQYYRDNEPMDSQTLKSHLRISE